MALSDRPAERHRQVAGVFSERARGTRSWDVPAPVAGWTARDVVRHLTGWFSAFLSSGAGIDLPRGPSVDQDPVAAWQVHCDGVQAVLDEYGPRIEVPADADTQTRLLGFIGRDPFWPGR